MANSRTALFQGRDEFLNLIWPLFFAVPLLYLVATGNAFGDDTGRRVLRAAESILFLDVPHALFTFFMLRSLPELRALDLGERRRRGFGLSEESAGVFVILAAFFIWGAVELGNRGLRFVLSPVLLILALHHGLRQTSGLSQAYDHRLRASLPADHPDLRAIEASARFEAVAFDVFLYLVMAVPLLRIFPETAEYRFAMRAAVGLAALAILWNTWRSPARGRSNKLFYQLRILLYPFTFHFVAVVALGAIHGVEYLFVSRTMVGNSRGRPDRGMKIGLAAAIVFASLCVIAQNGETRGFAPFLAPLMGPFAAVLPVMDAIVVALGYTHFYLDRRLFRMRNQPMRESTGRLLIGGPAASAAASQGSMVEERTSLSA